MLQEDPCKECAKLFDCYEPCTKVINWEPLTETDSYQLKPKPKGVGAFTSLKQHHKIMKKQNNTR